MSLPALKFKYHVLAVFICTFGYTNIFAEQPSHLPSELESSNCSYIFAETGKCPLEICDYGCFALAEDGCRMACKDKACVFIKNQFCPSDRCQIFKSCEGNEICYFKMKSEPPACGEIGYNGQEVECCAGLIKRCGVEMLDGSCNMLGQNSIYAVPSCIPCGNRICDQFENKCNCPEDCL